jgi:putative tryptophan/tyrosine transport system substrate-binding protein
MPNTRALDRVPWTKTSAEVGRRKFITLLGSATALWPLAGIAQVPPKRPLVAWLSGSTQTASSGFADNFLQGMREFGYVEGRNFDMVYRFSDGFQDRLPTLTEEVVRLKPDVILATAVVTAVVAMSATSTIPIVCPALADAVHLGLITSEGRPGRNVTGIEPYVAGLPAKQMQFAREIVPGASRVGLLTDLNDPKAPPQIQELQAAGQVLHVSVVTAGASRPDEIDGALQALAQQRVDVVIVLQSSMLLSERRQIAALALTKRLPTVYGYREHVVAGGLISYGVDLRWCFHRGAYFVDKILRGTAPGDLPVEFPTKMVLAINLKTARALGMTTPPMLLGRADEVIE